MHRLTTGAAQLARQALAELLGQLLASLHAAHLAGETQGRSGQWSGPSQLAVLAAAGYFPEKVEKAGKVVRAIAILAHPIPNTDNAASAQIILPQRQTGRKNDIYVFCCSASHHVCAPDKWLAFVSTIVETTDPERELQAGAFTNVSFKGILYDTCWVHMLMAANASVPARPPHWVGL